MNTPRLFTVTDRRDEITATVTLELQPLDDQPLPVARPGQFNMLYSFGAGEVPISLSGSINASDSVRSADRYTHTLRAVGKTTEALARLQVGDQLGVRGPFGRGWPMDQLAGKKVVVIAGGLGLAPLKPLLEALLADITHYGHVQLFYGGKRPEELLYPESLIHWSEKIEVQLSVDQAGPDWRGHVGVITQLLASAEMDPDNTLAVICGPEIMMRFTIQALQKQGLPDTALYLSMERNMHCAVGHCGHCQWGPHFICKDGPVFCYADIAPWFFQREL
ncbi:FAD/NAD(P)-binding protein [Pseudomaricurvus hydrocarbonicus]|uniref:FAD/NAD(P)-binding protein n=1 Tax=Pseudomaricurvus hydrocarbonicus TaxID=1470433 RepID=UPI00312C6F82